MLAAVVEDFAAHGMHVRTTLDSRLTLDLSAQVEPVTSRTNLRHVFEKLAGEVDAALVIAPECDGVLPAWLRRLAKVGTRSLGCDARAAALCGDKLMLARRLEQCSVRTPATQVLRVESAPPCPLIVKPRCGAGCEETWLITRREDLAKLPPGDWIVQPRHHGLAASGSAIVHDDGTVRLLPPGEQAVMFDRELRYEGGRLPLAEPLAARATTLVRQAIAAVPGLRGFVGVDLVLGEEPAGDCVIEINPRLTMSYCGLRAICRENLAAAMLDPAVQPRWNGRGVQFDSAGRVAEPVA